MPVLPPDNSASRQTPQPVLDLLVYSAHERAQRLEEEEEEEEEGEEEEKVRGPYGLSTVRPRSLAHARRLAASGSPWALLVVWLHRAFPRLNYSAVWDDAEPGVTGTGCALLWSEDDDAVAFQVLRGGEAVDGDAYDLYNCSAPAQELRRLRLAVVAAEGAPELGWDDAETGERLRFAALLWGRMLCVRGENERAAYWIEEAKTRATTAWERTFLGSDDVDSVIGGEVYRHVEVAGGKDATLPRSWLHMNLLFEQQPAPQQHPWVDFLYWAAHTPGLVFEDEAQAEVVMGRTTFLLRRPSTQQVLRGATFSVTLQTARWELPRAVLEIEGIPKRTFEIYSAKPSALAGLKEAVVEAVTIKGLAASREGLAEELAALQLAESSRKKRAPPPPPQQPTTVTKKPRGGLSRASTLTKQREQEEAANPQELGWGELADEALRLRELAIAQKHAERAKTVDPGLARSLLARAQVLEADAVRGLAGEEELQRLREAPRALAVAKARAFKDLFVTPTERFAYTPLRSTRHLTLIRTEGPAHPWAQFIIDTVLPWVHAHKHDPDQPFSKAELFSPEQLVRTPRGSVRLVWRGLQGGRPVARTLARNAPTLQKDFTIYAPNPAFRVEALAALTRFFNTYLA